MLTQLKYQLQLLLAASLFFTASGLQAANPPAGNKQLPLIVTSFSILQDITSNLAGNKAEVVTLVGPNSDAHVYQPKPADIRQLANAKMVIENGLGFEGWLSRLLAANSFAGITLVASDGISPIYKAHKPNQPDPHAWHSFAAIKIYINNITTGLIKLSPADKEYFLANQQAYLAKVNQLETELKQEFAAKVTTKKNFLVPHAAFAYLESEFNVGLVAPQGISTSSEPSAKQLAELIKQLEANQIVAIFNENLSSDKFMQLLSQASNLNVVGTLYSDSLSTPKGPAPSYLHLMQHNIKSLIQSL